MVGRGGTRSTGAEAADISASPGRCGLLAARDEAVRPAWPEDGKCTCGGDLQYAEDVVSYRDLVSIGDVAPDGKRVFVFSGESEEFMEGAVDPRSVCEGCGAEHGLPAEYDFGSW